MPIPQHIIDNANALTTVEECLEILTVDHVNKQVFVQTTRRLAEIKAVLKDDEDQQYKIDNLLSDRVDSFDVIDSALVEVTE